MATSGSSSCGPCSRIDKTSSSAKWCMECEESLCEDCIVTHKTIKSLISHHVIEIELASSVAAEDLSCNRQCKLHPDFIIDYFCTFHDVVCCRSCIAADHRTCESVIPLEIAAMDVTNSVGYKDLTDGMNQICTTLQTIADDREQNIQRIKQEGEDMLLAITSFKSSIVQALDEKEKLLNLQLNKIQTTSITKLETEKNEAEKSVAQMKKYLQKIHFMGNNGSNRQAFLLLQELKTVLKEEDMHLEQFINRIETVSMVFSKGNVFNRKKSLGSVEIKSNTSDIKFNPLKCTGAQELTTGSKKTITFFSLESKINYKTASQVLQSGICGIIVTENNQVIVGSPVESALQMYSIDGKYIKSCKLAGPPWDISYNYQTKQIATTLKRRESLQIIENFESVRDEWKVRRPCYGVAWAEKEKNIFVGGNRVLHILDLNDKKVRIRTVKIGARNLIYVHYDNKKVYFSDYRKVYCTGENGTELFKFSSPNLKGPDGITTDSNGNVYVVGRQSNNIHRLSSDGTESEILLDETDGIIDPIALCFNMDCSKLLVSNDSGKHMLVFKCEY